MDLTMATQFWIVFLGFLLQIKSVKADVYEERWFWSVIIFGVVALASGLTYVFYFKHEHKKRTQVTTSGPATVQFATVQSGQVPSPYGIGQPPPYGFNDQPPPYPPPGAYQQPPAYPPPPPGYPGNQNMPPPAPGNLYGDTANPFAAAAQGANQGR